MIGQHMEFPEKMKLWTSFGPPDGRKFPVTNGMPTAKFGRSTLIGRRNTTQESSLSPLSYGFPAEALIRILQYMFFRAVPESGIWSSPRNRILIRSVNKISAACNIKFLRPTRRDAGF